MFGFGNGAARGFGRIGVRDLDRMREERPDLVLVDVREPFELTAFGAIPGVVNIPLDLLAARAAELPQEKERPVVAVCQSGARSLKAASILAGLGYRNVYSLDGGTLGWLATKR